jgi:hypothetical protein
MKEDEAGATVISRLDRVELGEDDDGEIMSSCVIVAGEGPAAARAVASKDDWGTSKTVKRLRGIIMAMLAEQGTDLRPWADGPMVRALRIDLAKAEFFKTHYTDGETEKAKQNAKRMAFKRALAAAEKAIVTREVGGVQYVWLRSAQAGAQAGTARPAAPMAQERLATVHAEWGKAIGIGETRSLDHVIKVAAHKTHTPKRSVRALCALCARLRLRYIAHIRALCAKCAFCAHGKNA